ncbi:hypothetical protein DFH05DRAFT_1525825 [Lentinula detonsa]|uniref:DUF6699 domain-containing protein n=1 Tax=Lentinula detonsa TaxID=2804962 RepID=A0A9W8TWZ5_9AGAR|nr:hypothetical protein DFH05DRAFT_1531460 [Lentinula detonsa]KAJ3743554.1 hypothetical protein DFH05DRAFT_1525825 [Lentinula detonsa]
MASYVRSLFGGNNNSSARSRSSSSSKGHSESSHSKSHSRSRSLTSSNPKPTIKKTVPKFYLRGSSPTGLHHPSSLSVSCADVLHAVHTTLSHPATPEEWDALGRGSHAQRKISLAYDRRCRSLGSGWDGGIRRVDWLGEKFRLIGVEVEKDSDSRVGNLVFGRS